MIKLSILIPTTPDREPFMVKLRDELSRQIAKQLETGNIEILEYLDNKEKSVGFKRNWLTNNAQGNYIAFFDSDDRPGPKYIWHALNGISLGVDVCGLTGIYTENGLNPKKFIHSIEFDSWYEKDNIYYRNSNHLNTIKREIAIQMRFPDKSHGEDHDYSKQLLQSGLLKTEYWDKEEVIYHYDWVKK